MNLKSTLKTVLCSIVILGAGYSQADQAELDQEINDYIAVFKGKNFKLQQNAINELAYVGISDERLWDVVEDELLDIYLSDDKYVVDRASWLAKSLGTSGNTKYRPTLEMIIDSDAHRTTIKWAKKSLERMAEYRIYNPVIAKGTETSASGTLAQTRVKNMLQSSHYPLMVIGGKRVYHAHSDDASLVAAARDQMMKLYSGVDDNQAEAEDAIAWLIKAVGISGNSAYIADLETIVDNTDSGKVKKFAKRALKQLQSSS
jgi:hypothetical protein